MKVNVEAEANLRSVNFLPFGRMRDFLKTLFFLLGSRRKKLPVTIFFFFVVSFLDILGIGLIPPYISLVFYADTQKYLTRFGISPEAASLMKGNDFVILVSFGLLILFFVKAVLGIYINRRILAFCTEHGTYLRSYLMKTYKTMPYEKFLEKNSSDYVHQVQELAPRFSHTALQAMLRFTSDGIILFCILGFLAWSNLLALAILTTILLGTMLLYDLFFKNKLKTLGQKSDKLSTEMIQSLQEAVYGYKEIRVLGVFDYFYWSVRKNALNYTQANIRANSIKTAPKYLVESLMMAFVVCLVIATILLGQDLATLLPVITMFGVAAIRLVPTVNQMMTSVSLVRYNMDAMTVLHRILSDYRQYTGGDDLDMVLPEDRSIPSAERFVSLTLSNIGFKYAKASEKTLKDISLTIKAGDVVGIIGPSGAGKTTLVDLILGLLIPTEGTITINGKPKAHVGPGWQNSVAYLPQQVFLIDDTVSGNVALGLDAADIDEKRVLDSLQRARLSEWVSSLEKGTDTILGEHGVRLSGGQRQRIALARAFYFNKDIIVMDESTSALDTETEKEIVKEFNFLRGSKTIIVIAHRLTTLEHCDKIFKIEGGRLIAEGSYAQIIGGAGT